MKRRMGAREALSALQRALRQLMATVSALLVGEQRVESLEGQLALVTGSGAGLGRELAVQLCGLGCRVVCVDSELRAVQGTAEIIKRQVGPGLASAYACDPSDHQEALRLSREVVLRHGAVDLLVLADSPEGDFCSHLGKQFWVCLGLLPAMVMRGAGRVLAVCSEGMPEDAASSHSIATTSLIQALSEQLQGTNVRLTCAHRYQLTTQELQLGIPELSDECVATEMLAALRRGHSSVVVPARTLFWHSVLRSLHLGGEAGSTPLQLPTSQLNRSTVAPTNMATVTVKS